MKYKIYDPKTKKAELVDEEDMIFPKGINSFEKFLEKYGKPVKNLTEKEKQERARTDRERYWDEHFGLGQYSRDRQGSGTSYTQNNYYGRRDW